MEKSRSIERLESRMRDLSPQSLRYRVLEAAKGFKNSWIELGQYLHTVYSDKLYRDWGHATFESYCAREIGIRQATAVKLLRSYTFLEKEEPDYLKSRSSNEQAPTGIAAFESVNALRLAKQSARLASSDYAKIRAEVLEKGGEPAEVRKKIKYYLKPAEPKPVSQAERKSAAVKKLVSSLEGSLSELSNLSFPQKVLKRIEELLDLLSEQR